MKKEIWKMIKNYENFYMISNYGNIKSLEHTIMRSNNWPIKIKSRILKPHITKKGYLRIQLQVNGVGKNYMIHRLVAEAFIPNHKNKPEVNHKNGIKTDNFYENLEWVTAGENLLHAYKYNLKFPIIKWKVHCVELNITTFGIDKMMKKLYNLGYNVNTGGICNCLHKITKTHMGLSFTGEII